MPAGRGPCLTEGRPTVSLYVLFVLLCSFVPTGVSWHPS